MVLSCRWHLWCQSTAIKMAVGCVRVLMAVCVMDFA